MSLGGTPREAKNATCSQHGPRAVLRRPGTLLAGLLEASWRPLGSLLGPLGRPKREPRGTKMDAWRVSFGSWNKTCMTSSLGGCFYQFLDPLGGAKVSISYWRGCKNKLFRKLHLNIDFRAVWMHFGGQLGPSWGQVGGTLGPS